MHKQLLLTALSLGLLCASCKKEEEAPNPLTGWEGTYQLQSAQIVYYRDGNSLRTLEVTRNLPPSSVTITKDSVTQRGDSFTNSWLAKREGDTVRLLGAPSISGNSEALILGPENRVRLRFNTTLPISENPTRQFEFSHSVETQTYVKQ